MKRIVFIIFFLLLTGNVFAQDTLVINKPYIPYPDTTLIITPGNNSQPSEMPLVFLLNGWSGNYAQWNIITDVQSYSDKYNMIIVCPDGFYDSWYLDNPFEPRVQFERFFWKDLVPKILQKYKVDTNKIFISGLSMGGHGAMTLFLKHPDFFLSAGSTSGILDLTAFPEKWGIKKGIGNYNDFSKVWKSNSAIYLLQNIVGMNKQIIFDCGTEDFSYDVNNNFRAKCRKLKIKATFISQPGNHNAQYWHHSIKAHFEFFNSLITVTK